ncbi:hypothetical protein HPP92_015172 [Vanilla planifolia]|uniref:Dual specificity protein phosphatase 4 n=1 Tax=Vanilla planifolia TaxID=51239 RepID=A0A835QHD1_VANPL|nr:hypothetical protein HPP92_015172 [Vanilla planifolia]
MFCLQKGHHTFPPVLRAHSRYVNNKAWNSRSTTPLVPITAWTISRRALFSSLEMVRSSILLPFELRINTTTNVFRQIQASSSSAPRTEAGGEEMQQEKSEIYNNNMAEAMGAVLTYRHELGMNYNFILPDLIVGSCLQTPSDVDKLIGIGVRTIFCLQQNADLEYFGVDIQAIERYAIQNDKIEHCRAEIRDFDAFDLRMRLPAVVSRLHKAINRNGGVTYIHCTAGLGRAPSVALAFMYWILGYKLSEANKLLQSKRSCCPKLEAIRLATTDILMGLPRTCVRLTWKGGKRSSVEISGLDVGWGQRIPLTYDESKGFWHLERNLPGGRYEYKYIVDGEWTCNSSEPMTRPNNDGHVNNYVDVFAIDSDPESKAQRKRLMGEDELTNEEKQTIREFLELYGES